MLGMALDEKQTKIVLDERALPGSVAVERAV